MKMSADSKVFEAAKKVFAALQKNAGAGLAAVACAAALTASQDASALETKTYDQLRAYEYNAGKSKGFANTCPGLDNSARGSISLEKGKKYEISDFCMQPTQIFIKAETGLKKDEGNPVFQQGRLMTRQTYTLDQVEGDLFIGDDGKVTFEETDGFDYQPLTVKLPGGELVPMLFSIKKFLGTTPIAATGISPATEIEGDVVVPSYRGGAFLDPKGRGVTSGYDNAVALPAKSDDEELIKENNKSALDSPGHLSLQVVRVDGSSGEFAGVFNHEQLSDTDLGAKVPKEIKLSGVFYGRVNQA
uniref:33kDa oxygen evolving protein of photosystem II n=1 Tax=Gloeochaete wittrockiana TaxID=38269 RepID=A9CM91_9EUKA|nr:33kDa oxygen evolving protein of photosystem II [Gloeochaete wittrockiana]